MVWDLNWIAFAQQPPSGKQQQQNRPKILLVVGDDFGWSDIGAFGSQIFEPVLRASTDSGNTFGKILD